MDNKVFKIRYSTLKTGFYKYIAEANEERWENLTPGEREALIEYKFTDFVTNYVDISSK